MRACKIWRRPSRRVTSKKPSTVKLEKNTPPVFYSSSAAICESVHSLVFGRPTTLPPHFQASFSTYQKQKSDLLREKVSLPHKNANSTTVCPEFLSTDNVHNDFKNVDLRTVFC